MEVWSFLIVSPSHHITNAAFLHNDSYVNSAAGADLCSLQWKVVS